MKLGRNLGITIPTLKKTEIISTILTGNRRKSPVISAVVAGNFVVFAF
jgi:hypothetical protein